MHIVRLLCYFSGLYYYSEYLKFRTSQNNNPEKLMKTPVKNPKEDNKTDINRRGKN